MTCDTASKEVVSGLNLQLLVYVKSALTDSFNKDVTEWDCPREESLAQKSLF